LPAIRQAQQAGMQVVGMALDTDRKALRAFATKHKLDWTQVHFTDPELQGWKNPVTTHFGVLEVPAFWLIDANGNVVSTTATVASLKQDLRQLMETSGLVRQKGAETEGVVPVGGTQEPASGGSAASRPAGPKSATGKGAEPGAGKGGPATGGKGPKPRPSSR
jgi:hypothetical protein